MSRVTLNFKIVVEILVSDTGEINHPSMSRVTPNFKIVAEILVSDTGGGQSSFHMQAKSYPG